MQVQWTAAALRGVWHAYQYLDEFNPRAAMSLAESLLLAGDSLANFPHRGRLVPKTHYRELLTIPPYVIRYRVASDQIVILRVRHSARRPTAP